MKKPLSEIEHGRQLEMLVEMLPILTEIAEKYQRTKHDLRSRPSRNPSESRFIRSFRKKEG
ncbi:MAG: hypothetical protein U5N86_06845 [Planctomycetota bacterium]|nr:hypothetical protein [Planctomycetota bacterium]